MTTVFHTWLCGRFVDIYRATSGERDLIEQMKAPIFSKTVLVTDNVRAPIQFRRESQPQHLKKMIFPQEQTDRSGFLAGVENMRVSSNLVGGGGLSQYMGRAWGP